MTSAEDRPKASRSSGEGLDETFYTWSTFFKILLGTATDHEANNYLNVRDVKNEDNDCQRCEQYKEYLFKYSPIIKFLREQIRETADGPDISPSTVHCHRCPLEWRRHGGFSDQYGIMLCANILRQRSRMEDTLAHEMIHAYDHVRFKVDHSNLRHMACTEIRAAMLSGECRFMRQWGPFHKLSRGWEDCVKRRAALAIRGHRSCRDDVHAAKTVNEVWQSCSADTRPFDEVYR